MNSHTAVVIMFFLFMAGICTAIYVTECGWWLLAVALFEWESHEEKDNEKDNEKE